MKKARSAGLIGAGNLADSLPVRLHRLSESLGPVKSTSLRVASRISNTLRAGRPVVSYRDFDSCSLILVSVPSDHLPRVVTDLLAAGISWRGKSILLCSDWQDSSELAHLAARGASVGSISLVPGFDNLYLV